MADNKYPCTQGELYACCYIGWKSYGNNLARFTNFKGFYTALFGTARVGEVDAAKALPDEQTRDEVAETLRILLIDKGTECTDGWQQLKRYIASAYPDELQKPKLEAAGSDYYREATNENWEDLSLLMQAGSNFIGNNTADLTANNNMPLTFQNDFNTLKTDYDALYLDFKNAEQIAFTLTENKINANNAIYDKLIEMFLDGQQIYKKEPATMKQFVFESVLELVSSPGSSGLKGTVTKQVDGTPIEGAKLTLVELVKAVETDALGKYDFGNFAAGTYTLRIEAAGFVTIEEKVVIETGVVSTKDFAMAGV